MVNNKLIQLFQTFETADFRRFREYLQSPFFNKREDLVELYAVLEALAPEFHPEKVTKEKIWKSFAPGRKLDNKELTYLLSFLFKHAENYLAVSLFEEDETTRGTFIMARHLETGLLKHYRSAHRQTVKQHLAKPVHDAEWHLKAWRLADAEVHHFYRSKSRKPNVAMEEAGTHLDAFYLDKKLEMGSEVLNLNQILQAGMDTRFIDELRGFLDNRDNREPSVRIRLLLLNVLLDPEDEASFQVLIKLLPQTPPLFSPDRVQGIFAHAQNFCIRRIKTGDLRYQETLLDIYKTSLASGVMYEEGYLNPWNFKNVVSIALKLSQFEWTQSFIQQQQQYLRPEFRENAIAYNLANLHFHQQEYKPALKSLMSVEFSDVFYALDTRRMMLMIYFEQEEEEAFLSLVSSFRTFLRRNKIISRQNKAAYKNFVDALARIFRARESGNTQRMKQLATKIQQTSPLVEGEWLLSKLSDLMG